MRRNWLARARVHVSDYCLLYDVCMYVCVYVWTCMRVCMYMCMCVCIYVFMKKGRKEMFYLTTYSTHFIYGNMASDIW